MRGSVLVIAAVSLLGAADAAAFPELGLRSGAPRCNACHFAPAGGGLINGYGRDEAGDTLSLGGEGAFLHGAVELPGWLAVGGDVRAAALANDVGATEGAELAAFPMQADVRLRAAQGAWSLQITAGLVGSTRLYTRASPSYVASSEHYVMWRPRPQGAYVRAGRFFPPMGLRLPDHTLYIRRYTGSNLYEEPYAASAGVVRDAWELHASAFVRDPLMEVSAERFGAVGYAEAHGGSWAAGLSARAAREEGATRLLAGITGRAYLAAIDLAILAEADAFHEIIDDDAGDRTAIIGYLGLDLRVMRGLQLAAWGEHMQDALDVSGTNRESAGAAIKWYPRAHWEVLLQGRWQIIGNDDQARMAMLQIHYYL
jgi:hypothetical protein